MSEMDLIVRERVTDTRLRGMDGHEIVAEIHSLEDLIERLSAKPVPVGYVVLKYEVGDIVRSEFILDRERAEETAKSRQSFALQKGMGTTYGVGTVLVASDPTEDDS